ncbi:50S ribosomal protein L24 [Candidatus Giovannonibacteria bacterium]|nr:50S ribosomal protein L24 [Candidatus Giovannonibacteria bacterium]
MRVKKGDIVSVVAGKDKGREGKILRVFTKENRALVEGLGLVKRHQRPKRGGEKGSIISVPSPINLSKLLPKCPHCGKSVRVGINVSADGKRSRVCKKCGQSF